MNRQRERVRFKYLLGEILLADWRPMLLTPPTSDDPLWPSSEDVPKSGLSGDAAGYCCRRLAPERFPTGISRFGDWLCYVPRRERLYYVDLAGTMEDYLARRSAKSRYNLKRTVKQFRDRNVGNVLDVATTPEAMATFHREAVAISRRTYQSQLLQAGLPEGADFLAAMEDLARKCGARGYVLRDQGKAIAFAWCSGRGTELTYDVIGYLPEHAAASPGTVLLYLILEDLFRVGRFTRFDFGVGEAQYKAAFATAHLDFCDAYLFRPTLSHRLRISAHSGLDRFSGAVGDWLARRGIKARIRSMIRRLRGAG